jgi:hypothetical protein
MAPLPDTIDGVIERMDQIIAQSLTNGSRLGYFAALYRRVTIQIKKNIDDRTFENPQLLEQLAVTFAGRYFTALESYQTGSNPTAPWLVAFDATKRRRPIILQHLLLGMNAHINLDLAIASAQTSPSIDILTLKTDFIQVNAILAAEVPTVLSVMSKCSPFIGLVTFFYKHAEEKVAHFSMAIARAFSWLQAEDLAVAHEMQKQKLIERSIEQTNQLALHLYKPKILVRTLYAIVALVESNDVRRNITILSQ